MRCVVTFAKGSQRYTDGLARLKASFQQYGVDVIAFTNEDQIPGCPSHGEIPYAFKSYAIREAIRRGYNHLLWCDSVIYAKKNPAMVFDWIKKNGTMLFHNIGFTVGEFTSDECLKQHGVTRDEAFRIPMIMACCMGIRHTPPPNLASGLFGAPLPEYEARRRDEHFLYFYGSPVKYIAYGCSRSSYCGDWTNERGQVSADPRVRGHRHDQSVASLLAHEYEIPLLTGHETFFTYEGHPGMQPVAPSVCLFSK